MIMQQFIHRPKKGKYDRNDPTPSFKFFPLFFLLGSYFYFFKSSKITFFHKLIGGFLSSFLLFFFTVGLSLSCTHSNGSVRKRARSARFGVYGVEVFYRQQFRQNLIIPGQHLRNR